MLYVLNGLLQQYVHKVPGHLIFISMILYLTKQLWWWNILLHFPDLWMPEASVSHDTALECPATQRGFWKPDKYPRNRTDCARTTTAQDHSDKRYPPLHKVPRARIFPQKWRSTAKHLRSSCSEKVRVSKLPRALNIFTKTMDYRHRPVARQEPGSLKHQRMYSSPRNDQEHTRSLWR
jgi:hypothetical protein